MALKVTLPDGTIREYPDGSNALHVAESISKGLAKVVVLPTLVGGVKGIDTYIGTIDHNVNALAQALR